MGQNNLISSHVQGVNFYFSVLSTPASSIPQCRSINEQGIFFINYYLIFFHYYDNFQAKTKDSKYYFILINNSVF